MERYFARKIFWFLRKNIIILLFLMARSVYHTDVVGRRHADIFFEKLSEIGDVVDAALRGDFLNSGMSHIEKADGETDPLLIDVGGYRDAHLLFEESGEVAWIDKIPACQLCQRQFFGQMDTDMIDNLPDDGRVFP